MDEETFESCSLNYEETEEILIVKSEPTSSCCRKICVILKLITLEPCLFVYFLALTLESPLQTTILLDKTCTIKLNYSTEVCDNLTNFKDEQIIVERETNHILMLQSIIRNLPSILFVLFLGSWSDKHGRKIPLILPFVGGVLSSGIMLLNTLFWSLPPEFILLSAVPSAITGGFTCLIMSMYSYLSDITTVASRTTRVAFYDTFLMMGPSCGLFLSSICKEHLKYFETYIIVGGLYAICIIYIIVHIDETRGYNSVSDADQELQPKSTTLCKDLVDWKNVQETFKTTFKKRINYGRAKIILLMIAICLMVMEFSSLGLELLYTEYKFNWTFRQYTNWAVATLLFQVFGMAFFFPLLSYKIGVRDEFLAVVGGLAAIGFNVLKAFAEKNRSYEMYIASAVGMVKGVPIIISRSMVSKIVPGDACGKVFSVLGSWESFIPLVASPLYTLIYNSTILVFPGSFYLVNAAIFLVSIIIYLVIFKLNQRGDESVFRYEGIE